MRRLGPWLDLLYGWKNHDVSTQKFIFRPGAPGRCLEGPGMSSLPGNHDQQENIPGYFLFKKYTFKVLLSTLEKIQFWGDLKEPQMISYLKCFCLQVFL